MVYIWGDTFPGIEQPIFVPINVCANYKFSKIALGHSHFLGLSKEEKKVIAFGINKNNCMGIENNPNTITTISHQNATEIDFLQDVLDISANYFTSAAINGGGRSVYYWGNNIEKFTKQKKVFASFSYQNKKLVSVSVGDDFMLVSTFDGYLLSCGNNSKNQLGRLNNLPTDSLLLPVDFGEDPNAPKEKKALSRKSNISTRLEPEKSSSVSFFNCARTYSVAERNGLVYIWGFVEDLRHFPSRIETPTIISGLEDLQTKYIYCGEKVISSVVGLKNLKNIRFLSFKPPQGKYFNYLIYYFFYLFFLIYSFLGYIGRITEIFGRRK